MATVVGQASAAATSVAIPAHQAGDLILVAARGTAAAPSVPAAGGTVPAWTTLQSGLANSIGLTVVAVVAPAATPTPGAFTNATHVAVVVLRPAAGQKLQTAAADSSVGNANNTQTIVYPALVLNTLAGTSQGVRIGTRTVADSEVGTNIPAGWTNQVIQPAGASALMAVHTRLGLTANPTADSIATTGSNAAYRAVTVEVEEVPVVTALAVTVAGTGGVSAQADRTRSLAVPVAGAAAVSPAVVKPITFEIDLATNQPYAGEHDAGEFLAGKEPVLSVDLQIVDIAFLDGLIAGQAQVGASLSVSHELAVSVARAAAVVAQDAVSRGLAVSIDRTAGVVAQVSPTRGLTAAIAGQGVVAADIQRVGLAVSFAATIARAGAVTAALTVTTPSATNLDADISGQASVAASLTSTPAVRYDAPIAGQAQVTAALGKLVTFSSSVQGQAALAAQATTIKSLSASVVGKGVLSPVIGKLILLDVRIQAIVPLCGEHICGTFVCGITDGPFSVVTAGMTRTHGFFAPISGESNIQVDTVRNRSLTVEVGGQAEIIVPWLSLKLALATQILGQATVKAKLILVYLWPSDCTDIDLDESYCVDEIPAVVAPIELVSGPAPEEDFVLVGSVPFDLDLDESECR